MKKICLFPVLAVFPFIIKAQQKPEPATNTQALADKLANPVANMISVPVQSSLDDGIGQYNGSKYTINVQPVIPFKLSSRPNPVTGYIVPVVGQCDISGDNTNQFGLSDATISCFFSSSEKPKNGLIWGIGPTVLLLKQLAGLPYGFLINQTWSFTG